MGTPPHSPRPQVAVVARQYDRMTSRFVYEQVMKIGPVVFPLLNAVGESMSRAACAMHNSVCALGQMIAGQPL